MPNIFCPNPPGLCEDEALPTANYSSEAPDQNVFFGRSYNVQQQPPLGSPWQSTGCIGTCTSTISQADANACAQRQLMVCLSGKWPEYEDNPNDDPEQPPVVVVNRQTFLNDQQTCDFTCADGQVFTYTVPAGTVSAFSLAAANSFALSMACNGSIDNRICIGDPTPAGACLDEEYSGTCTITAPERPGGYTISLQAGSLPPGLSTAIDGNTISFPGTPTSAGEYPFVIQVSDQEGNFMQKTVTIYVVGILPATLPDASVGAPYSVTFTSLGPVLGTVTWTLVGTLPSGLTFSVDTISGTPTTEETDTFTVTMSDER